MSISIDTTDKQVKVNPGASLLNLNFSDIVSLLGNPLATAGEDKQIHVVGVLHNDQLPEYSFYIENLSDRVGWNVTDCTDTTDPVPALPFGALPVPVNVTDLVLDVTVKAYGSKSEAATDTNALTTLEEGSYLVFGEPADNGMLRVGKTRDGIKYWINPADNQVPVPEAPEPTPMNWVDPRANSVEPEPEPIPEPEVMETLPDITWKDSYHEFAEPRIYKVNQEGRAWNEDETQQKSSVILRLNDHVNVLGWFMKDGQKFYLLKTRGNIEYGWWVAVPQMFNGRGVLVLPGPTIWEQLFHHKEKIKKSIFKTTPVKFIDNVKNPYKEKIK